MTNPDHDKTAQIERYRVACLSAISEHPSEVPVVFYKRGARIHWPAAHHPVRAESAPRGKVGSVSRKSLARLVFAIANAPVDWSYMITLTFREEPRSVKQVLRRFKRLMRAVKLCYRGYAWIMEMQARGVPHFHMLMTRQSAEAAGFCPNGETQNIGRGSKCRTILRGRFEAAVVEAWSTAVGDTSDEFARFQAGGICELLRSDNGGAAYFGSYLGKEHQKELPFGREGLGRWFYISPDQKPKPEALARLVGWTMPFICGQVFDKTKLDGLWIERESVGEFRSDKP